MQNISSWQSAYLKLDQEFSKTDNSKRTLKLYKYSIHRFFNFVGGKSIEALALSDVSQYLDHLKAENQSESSRYQAYTALKFFFERVIDTPFDKTIAKPKQVRIKPVILSKEDVSLILDRLDNPYNLIAKLLYGCGLTTIECLNLRLKDIDIERRRLHVVSDEDHRDRYLPIPKAAIADLKDQMIRSLMFRELCLMEKCYEGTFMLAGEPESEAKTPEYQWLFPAKMLTRQNDDYRLYHLHESHLQRAVKLAVRVSRIKKKASCLTLRQTFAGHLLERNYSPETVRQLMGYSDIRLVQPYLKIIKRQTITEAASPLDF